ncbi:HNH endonuclease [Enterococcus saigonensis]|uniref:HNH endonuclease n=1 Tax=Enterococcus saigonensis TaxID=1805431 RepID=A0A679IP65_9ENTE|nr:NUMOD4 domain-containing protein [Enterococcus saigonensis]BCA86671.1 HNH endonuclease [Enterococcus saigonensis]
MINNTVWKPVKDYESLYEVSNTGKVKSLRNKKILALSITTTGYKKVELYKSKKKRSFKVHRLVATAFIENPKKLPIVNHLDGNPFNNCVENLEWCNQKRNMQHAYDIGLIPSKLHKYKKNLLDEYKNTDISLRALAKKYEVSPKSLSRLLRENNVIVRSISDSKDFYKIDKMKMVSMFDNGKGNKEIADFFNVNKGLIATYRCKYKKGVLNL